ncbi:MazG-like family protein [Eubacteriales bacterium OttesenSCG-928-M02]|nr:MazG-like family protein [Eubacteriales bacterium OttesenSCG-928-M02]
MQTFVHHFIATYQPALSMDPMVRSLDLFAEVGELGKAILQATNYGASSCSSTPAIQEEVGDSLFSLLLLCHALGLDASISLQQALDKYAQRLRRKGHIGSNP